MTPQSFIKYLEKKQWLLASQEGNYFQMAPPSTFKFDVPYYLHIPKQLDDGKVDATQVTNELLQIIAAFYNLPVSTLSKAISQSSSSVN